MQNVLELVAGLSSAEKIYFKKHLNVEFSGKKKNHILLYDAIQKRPEITLKELKEEFRNTSIYPRFSTEMNYLFDAVMKSIIQKDFEKTPQRKALKYLISADLLLERGITQMARQLILKAKESAAHYENYSTMIKALELEERLLTLEGHLPNSAYFDQLNKDRENAIRKIDLLSKIQLLSEQTRYIITARGYFNGLDEYHELLNHPLILNQPDDEGYRIKERWLFIQLCMNLLEGKYEGLFNNSVKYLSFISEKNQLFKSAFFVDGYSLYLKAVALTKRYDLWSRVVEEFRQCPFIDQINREKVNSHIIYRGLESAAQGTDKGFALEALKALNDMKIVQNKAKSSDGWMREYYFLSIICCQIKVGQFEEAFGVYDLWYRQSSKIHISKFMRMCKLILIFELNIDRLKDAELGSAKKFLTQDPLPKALQEPLLTFFRKAFNSQENQLENLKVLEAALVSFDKEPEALYTKRYFDFLAWCRDAIARMELNLIPRSTNGYSSFDQINSSFDVFDRAAYAISRKYTGLWPVTYSACLVIGFE